MKKEFQKQATPISFIGRKENATGATYEITLFLWKYVDLTIDEQKDYLINEIHKQGHEYFHGMKIGFAKDVLKEI